MSYQHQRGHVVLSNSLPAVNLDEDTGVLTVIVPEGAEVKLVPADSGLVCTVHEERCFAQSGPEKTFLTVRTYRVGPKPVISS